MIIHCSTEGCASTFEVAEGLAANGATFSCRNHTQTTGKKVRFQSHQFDKGMRRAAHPVGTTHIRRQGSETDDAQEEWGDIQGSTKEKK